MSTPFHFPAPRAVRFTPADLAPSELSTPARPWSPWPAPVAGAVVRSNAWPPPVVHVATWSPPSAGSAFGATVTFRRRRFGLRSAAVALGCTAVVVTAAVAAIFI